MINIEQELIKYILFEVDVTKTFSVLIDKKITKEYFSTEPYRLLYNLVLSFFKKYSKVPTSVEIEQIVGKSKYPQDIKTSIMVSYYDIVNSEKVFEGTFTFLCDTLLEDFEYRTIKDTVVKGAMAVESKNVDEAKKIFKDCLSKIEGVRNSNFELSTKDTIDIRFKNYENAKIPDNRKAVHLGFPTLDTLTGGIQPGELWIIEGWAKAGKSIFLLNAAFNAWKLGKNVLYVSSELAEYQVARRFDALGSGLAYDSLKFGALSESEEEQYKAFLSEVKEKSNYFNILYSPGISTLAINQKVLDLELKSPVELVIVDYLGICTAMKSGASRYEEVGNVALELRTISGTKRIPILTAHQKNRQGQLSGKLGTEYAGESIKVVQHCDMYAAIKTVDEEEKKLSPRFDVEFHTLATRDSGSCKLMLECVPSIMKMYEKH